MLTITTIIAREYLSMEKEENYFSMSGGIADVGYFEAVRDLGISKSPNLQMSSLVTSSEKTGGGIGK